MVILLLAPRLVPNSVEGGEQSLVQCPHFMECFRVRSCSCFNIYMKPLGEIIYHLGAGGDDSFILSDAVCPNDCELESLDGKEQAWLNPSRTM